MIAIGSDHGGFELKQEIIDISAKFRESYHKEAAGA